MTTGSRQANSQIIVVGVDGSEHGDAALGWALQEAELRRATVRVVHAWQFLPVVTEPMTAGLAAPVEEMAAAARVVVEQSIERVAGPDGPSVALDVRVVEGPATAAVLEAAADAALIVVGSRGRGGFTGLLLGSVSQQVTHHAHCPVVVIPKGAEV